MPLPAEVLGMLAFTLLAFWGISLWALTRTLRQESRKVEILKHQDRMDTYSPRALADLREWVETNPNDPLADRAREQYNECVDVLTQTDRHFYDWSDTEIEQLERL
ncbi:hypothetical protein C483_07814 [Natrialba hulunbeirensis JCM 10989]|uniref:Uncharacterized protein n=1 Tax=Natrialba hulunbeirensis JCM 10989 TaxID=1227493 RepID=M0A3S4_9EURY|nr:hypothetical protein [Natrialba hulunbeirensis]ELY92512.1 hypothetical protein C483_07814 [Natrialba hulunbeirensis JCM 10989]